MGFYRCTLESPFSNKEVNNILTDKIREQDFSTPSISTMFAQLFNSDNNDDKTWHGKINDNKFKIYRNINYRNSFLPIVHGKILSNPNGGSTIKINMRLSLFSIGFIIVFIYFSLSGIGQSPNQLTFAIQSLVFLALLTLGGFGFEVYKAIKLLKLQLNAH